jgi:hypothetical protein
MHLREDKYKSGMRRGMMERATRHQALGKKEIKTPKMGKEVT